MSTVTEQRPAGEVDATIAAGIEAGVAAHRAGDLDEARRHYLSLLQRDPSCADAWHLIGVLVQQMGDAQASIQFIARAIELVPDRAMYYANLATALHKLRRMDEAVDLYRKALELDPGFVDAACNLGNTYAWLERYEDALSAYARALDIDPACARAHYGQGQAHLATGAESAAMAAYRCAVTVDPDYADAQFALGRSLLKAGDADGALLHYQRFKATLPGNSPLRQPGGELYPVQSIARFCTDNGLPFRQFAPERTFVAPAPLLDNPVAHIPAATGTLAPAFVAAVGPADVVGWHDTILARTPRCVLYDMPTRAGSDALECEHGVARYVTSTHALIDGVRESGLRVPRGLMLVGRGWDSYAHGVVDFLPRLLLFEQCPEYTDWPLLVDAGLYPQQIDSLQRIVGETREVIRIPAHTRCRVDELVVASDLSGMRMQSYRPSAQPGADGAMVAPEALRFLRERMLGLGAECGAPRYGRRLYVSRRTQNVFRRLVNEQAIERLFVERGFEIVHPEAMSFAEQVETFNAASVVAGPAGSNMIDTIFCNPGTRILMLAMWHPRINYHFFANIAQQLGHQLLHVLGRIVARHDYYYQSDFMVELDDVRHAMRLLEVE